MELTTHCIFERFFELLFMMSKIQNLNGTHNDAVLHSAQKLVVYDVKDTKFEWNSQLESQVSKKTYVVYDVKDTKFEWNSQLIKRFPKGDDRCL